MFGKVSSSQGRVSLSGSGALSHVYIQHPLLRCNIPEIQGLYYDDGNKLLLAPTSDQVSFALQDAGGFFNLYADNF